MEPRDTRFTLTEVEPPETLLAGTLLRVHHAQRRGARIRLAFFGSSVAISGALLVPVFSYVFQAFYASGFSEYFSLLFSDTSLVIAHWQEISLSLAESIPSIAVLITLAVLVTFAWSVRKAVPVVQPAFSRGQFV